MEGLTTTDPSVDKESLAVALFRAGALRFGKFTLSSGKLSSYYLDLRVVPSLPELYSMVVEAYAQLARKLGEKGFDVIAGVATAGVTISSPLAFVLRRPMVYVRKEEKGHGLGKLVEGALQPAWRALVVDDLATTGGSVVAAVEALRNAGCVVRDALVLVDRLEGAEASLRAIGVKLHPYAKVSELVDVLYGAKMVTKGDYETVMKQFRASGTGKRGAGQG